VYQELNGERRFIKGQFVLKAHGQVSFDTACCYDRSHWLIIDPRPGILDLLAQQRCRRSPSHCR
jgi:hypothetical protein